MIIDCLSLILQEDGVPRCKADHVVKVCIHSCSTLKTSGITSIGDVARMFQQLRQKGFQIAINTSDSREATLQTLHHLGVAKLVDTVVCGDDDWMIVKPHPVSAFMICAQLGVLPENAIMVGDSPCDVRLGTNAQLGCSIGERLKLHACNHTNSIYCISQQYLWVSFNNNNNNNNMWTYIAHVSTN